MCYVKCSLDVLNIHCVQWNLWNMYAVRVVILPTPYIHAVLYFYIHPQRIPLVIRWILALVAAPATVYTT